MGKIGTIITRTPFRVSFFGGGTDLPEYFNRHSGAVLGTTINKYTYVVLNSLERLQEKRIKLSYSKLEMVEHPEEIQHDLVRQVLINGKSMLNGGFIDIHSFADLPHSSGVGSSSCFVVGFLNAFYQMHGIYKSPMQIAEEAIFVEREQLKHHGGWQDQVHAAFGGFNKIDFFNNKYSVTPIAFSPSREKALESSCMFYFTGIRRSSAEVIKNTFGESANKPSQADQDAYLQEMYLMVDQGMRILSSQSSDKEMVAEFGSLLNRAWECKRALSTSISSNSIDEIYETAMKAGAHGGKILGAGGGGCMLFIVPEDKKEAVSQALHGMSRINIGFERQGSRTIFVNH